MNFISRMIRTIRGVALTVLVSGSLAACGSQDASAAATEGVVAASAASPGAPAANADVRVIEVKMVTNGAENYFEPADFTVRQGDVVRFVLESGLHNVSFPAAQNPGVANLPSPSPFLQRAGEVYELTVDLAPGTYTYQCDPHIMMGMVGTMTVE